MFDEDYEDDDSCGGNCDICMMYDECPNADPSANPYE